VLDPSALRIPDVIDALRRAETADEALPVA
jgi:hypothetical protein